MTDVEAHETIREALSRGLRNANFYVSLKVTNGDPNADADVLDLDDLVRSEYGSVTVSLWASPWKRETRPHARPGMVGPHLPVIDGMD
jgi:hypothetical protein